MQCHEQHLKIAKDLGNKRERGPGLQQSGQCLSLGGTLTKAMSYPQLRAGAGSGADGEGHEMRNSAWPGAALPGACRVWRGPNSTTSSSWALLRISRTGLQRESDIFQSG